VRAVSFSTETFPYEEHVKWLETKLDDQNCWFYIAENSNQDSVGQIRFELKGREAYISISLDRKFRGQGHGARVIELAARALLASTDAKTIHAYIKKDNTASLAAFRKAGFSPEPSVLVNNQPADHLILVK
jgi:UDP-2,4-diacetamido-2,4,6-trideoxy-beta-L-altropyranose hydrolase